MTEPSPIRGVGPFPLEEPMRNPSPGADDFFAGPITDLNGVPIPPGDLPVPPAIVEVGCGALYDWEADGHPAGPQPPCSKPAGHQDGPVTDFKRAEHSNGNLKWSSWRRGDILAD